jgi:hypothetical protein
MLLMRCLVACCWVLSHRLLLLSSCCLRSRRLPHKPSYRQPSPQCPTAVHFHTQQTAVVSTMQQTWSSSQPVHQQRSLQVRHCGIYMTGQY